MYKSRRNNQKLSFRTKIGISLLSIILGFGLILFEEFYIGALLLMFGFALGLITGIRSDKIRRPDAYERTKVGTPLGYTRRFKLLLSLTVLMLVITAIVGVDSVWPLLATFFLVIFTIMYYLIDVKGKTW